LQVDGHVGGLGCEQVDQVRGEHERGGRRDAQPHGARLPAGDAVHGGLRRGDLVEDDLRAAEQFGAGAGEGHPAGGAGKQRRAQLTLQAPDQFTERRRGDVQPVGGRPKCNSVATATNASS
jgi:hypothetical protein